MTTPAWVRAEATPLEEAGSEKMQAEVAAERLHLRGVGRLPLDPDAAARELADEQRVQRSSRPRNRRWRALAKLDTEVERLQQRQVEAVARLNEAGREFERAPKDDAQTLASWIGGGERGARPEATVYERQRERDAAQLAVDALSLELDRLLERRLQHVERHRKGMLKDAQRDVDEARDRLLATVAELPTRRTSRGPRNAALARRLPRAG